MPPGRPHGLDEPDAREELSDLMVRGLNGPEIAELMGRHVDTIRVWRKDEGVQELVSKKRRERVNRFVSKIDAELEKRLEHPEKLTITELTKIRQTIQPRAAAGDGKRDPAAARRDWLNQDEETAGGEKIPIPSGVALPEKGSTPGD